MKQAILLASAALLAFTDPADAKPGKHGKGQQVHAGREPVGYEAGGCPPGLAKKNPRCMPPGRHRKLFEVGQRVPQGYDRLLGYNALPEGVRDHYGGRLDPRGRYIYDNNYIYRVDPKTMVVSEVLKAVLR